MSRSINRAEQGLGSDVFTGTGMAIQFPCEVWGIVLASSAPTNVEIFDGRSTAARRRLAFNDTNANGVAPMFPIPMHFEFGVFINLIAGAMRMTILYRPLARTET